MYTKILLNKLLFIVLLGTATSLSAAEPVEFPITELGGCISKADCRIFCDKSENIESCTAYAEANGLVSKDAAARARRLASMLEAGGPGNCKTEQTCRTYCADTAHIKECAEAARKHQLINSSESERLLKIADVRTLRDEDLPGDCTSLRTCRTYCAQAVNTSECLDFAERAKLIRTSEIDQARKMLPILENRETPGECASATACREYCADPGHREECADFGVRAGTLSAEQAEVFRRSGASGPGGCIDAALCRRYCGDPSHRDECVRFLQVMPRMQIPNQSVRPSPTRPIPTRPPLLRPTPAASAPLPPATPLYTLPPEMLRGAPTDQPTSYEFEAPRQLSRRHLFLSSFLNFFFGF